MGKKSSIKSVAKGIANISIHKILVKYSNKPESISHLKSEVLEYRDVAIMNAQEFNWSEKDKAEIKSNSMKIFKKEIVKRYPDVKFPMSEAHKIISETINEVI